MDGYDAHGGCRAHECRWTVVYGWVHAMCMVSMHSWVSISRGMAGYVLMGMNGYVPTMVGMNEYEFMWAWMSVRVCMGTVGMSGHESLWAWWSVWVRWA